MEGPDGSLSWSSLTQITTYDRLGDPSPSNAAQDDNAPYLNRDSLKELRAPRVTRQLHHFVNLAAHFATLIPPIIFM